MVPVLVSGPPGSGKSTLAPRLAERLGRTAIDLDREIERRIGTSLPALFAERGEAAFRAIESEVLDELMARSSVVIACGGGTLVDRARRHRALRRAVVVGLTAPTKVIVARCMAVGGRPLAASRAAIESLLALRAEGYAEVHRTIDTDALGPEVCVDRACEAVEERALVVPLGTRTYRVGFGPLDGLSPAALAAEGAAVRGPHLVVTDMNVQKHWSEGLARRFGAAVHAVVPVEDAKRISGLAALWDRCISEGLTRRSALVCVGGGVVTDLGGMAAATYLRGIAYVSAPTSLLAMADASVGGKTAINHPLGKNLLGVFHHPARVQIDTGTLSTLPAREFRSGMAEVVKIALCRDAALFEQIEAHADALASHGSPVLEGILRDAVQAKIDIVAEDEREDGLRAVLNFGHTLGHALEAGSGYRMRHGEAVSVGMVAALHVGAARGITPPALVSRVVSLLARLHLPLRASVSRSVAEAALAHDKKRAEGGVRMIFVRAPGETEIVTVTLDEARRALDAVCDQDVV